MMTPTKGVAGWALALDLTVFAAGTGGLLSKKKGADYVTAPRALHAHGER